MPFSRALRDFLRGTALADLPEEWVLSYDNVEELTGVLVYAPAQHGSR